MDTLLSKHWHHLPQNEVTNLLESNDVSGLDTFEVSHRQTHFDPNRLTQKKGKYPLILFLLLFHQPLVYILLAASAVTFALQEWVDSGVVLTTLAQLLFTYSPPMNQLFGSAPMGMTQWAWVLSYGLVIYTVVGLEKWQRLRSERKKEQ